MGQKEGFRVENTKNSVPQIWGTTFFKRPFKKPLHYCRIDILSVGPGPDEFFELLRDGLQELNSD